MLAKDKGTCGENNVPNHFADDQPIPGVATVPADSWEEDRQCQHGKGGALRVVDAASQEFCVSASRTSWNLTRTMENVQRSSGHSFSVSVHQFLSLSNILGHGHVNAVYP